MARAVCARFDDVLPIEHIYSLVRSPRQLERVLREIEGAPGVVLHTIVDKDLRAALEHGCRELEMPCVAALDPLVAALARYLGASISTRVGAQHALDNDYFNRMDALNYAIGHDDGQGTQDLESGRRGAGRRQPHLQDPDLDLSRPPGHPRANVPLVPGAEPPAQLFSLKRAVVVGLTLSPDRLIQIRRNRLTQSARDSARATTSSWSRCARRSSRARRLFERHGWPVIDVTRRSVEETAAAVINVMTAGRGQVEVLS